MNKEEEKMLNQYLEYLKKKRIIISSLIFVIVIISFIAYKQYIKSNSNLPISNEIAEENQQVNNEKDIIIIQNEIVQENVIDNTMLDSIQEESTEIEKNETKEIESVKEENTPSATTIQTNNSEKPSDKYFLFTDGYTMENVSEVAQNYLKSSGYVGECVPLKDSEGVYIGMKVIFY